MKNTIMLITIISICSFFVSCDKDLNTVKPDAQRTTKDYSFTDYNNIDISNDFEVELRFSETEESIQIEAPDNLHELMIVDKVGDELIIGFQKNTQINGNAQLKAYITTKYITGYTASGDSKFILKDKLNADEVEVKLSGDSELLGELAVNKLELDEKGDSQARLSGTVQTLDAKISGDSELKTYDLVVNFLNIDLSGDSYAELTVEEEIEIDASGESTLNYKGQAQITRQRLSGESTINNRN